MASRPSTLKIFLYQYLTLGIYFWVWCYRLSKDLSLALHSKVVPTIWWFVLPGGVYYWMWRMTESLELATGKRIKHTDTFLLYVVLSSIVFSGFAYVPHLNFNSQTQDAHTLNSRAVVIIVIIAAAILYLFGITLHAVFMSIVQNKLNSVRGNN